MSPSNLLIFIWITCNHNFSQCGWSLFHAVKMAFAKYCFKSHHKNSETFHCQYFITYALKIFCSADLFIVFLWFQFPFVRLKLNILPWLRMCFIFSLYLFFFFRSWKAANSSVSSNRHVFWWWTRGMKFDIDATSILLDEPVNSAFIHRLWYICIVYKNHVMLNMNEDVQKGRRQSKFITSLQAICLHCRMNRWMCTVNAVV